jgi:hypothetical protein
MDDRPSSPLRSGQEDGLFASAQDRRRGARKLNTTYTFN